MRDIQDVYIEFIHMYIYIYIKKQKHSIHFFWIVLCSCAIFYYSVLLYNINHVILIKYHTLCVKNITNCIFYIIFKKYINMYHDSYRTKDIILYTMHTKNIYHSWHSCLGYIYICNLYI
jgi:hypothetical protein